MVRERRSLRPLTARKKERALQLYASTPNIAAVAQRLHVDPLKLSNYMNTDPTARNMLEIQRDKAIGSQQDALIESMAEIVAMRADMVKLVRKYQIQGEVPDEDVTKSALTAAKQQQDLFTWATEQQNTAMREQAILEAFENQQATNAIAPIAQPLGLELLEEIETNDTKNQD